MYPTMEEVEAASHKQLARWYRFLPSPGADAIGSSIGKFEKALEEEAPIMNRIHERFTELGRMNPQLSKEIGL